MKTRIAVAAIAVLMSIPAFAQRAPLPPGNNNHPAPGKWCYPHPQCIGCEPGECAAIAHRNVGFGDYVYDQDPQCSDHSKARVGQLLTTLAALYNPQIATYVGPVFAVLGDELADGARRHLRGGLGDVVSRYTGAGANCELVCVYIPKNAQYTGYGLGFSDGIDGYHATTVGNKDAWKDWLKPYVSKTAKTQQVCGVFKNWSNDRRRGAWLIGYYRN